MWRISSFVVVMAVVVLSCSQKAMAETSAWVRRVYEVQEGLPSNIINAIAQDLEGYLWLGTAKGLVRFDGNRFRVWGEYGEQALPAHDIRTLIAAADGSLWIGFNGTGIVSRIAKGKVINYPSPDARIVSYIPVLFEDSAGVMWTGGRAGLARLEGSTWEHVTTSEERPPAAVYSMLEDDRGTLWLWHSCRRLPEDLSGGHLSPDVIRGCPRLRPGSLRHHLDDEQDGCHQGSRTRGTYSQQHSAHSPTRSGDSHASGSAWSDLDRHSIQNRTNP